MKKKSVFIVDDSINYVNELTRELAKEEDIFVVGHSLNGQDALDKIRMFYELDVLIINSVLPGKDGFQVMKEIKDNKQFYPQIKLILCQANLINDHIISLGANLGCHQFIQKPCTIQTYLNHIRNNNIENKQITVPINSINKRITRLLHDVGIPAHIKGYHYIREAIDLVIKKPNIIGQVTKTLYPTIAETFDSSSTKVERAIRHAIEIGWNRGNPDVIDLIFGYTISANKAKPTNSEFIAMLADYLILNEDQEMNSEYVLKKKMSY